MWTRVLPLHRQWRRRGTDPSVIPRSQRRSRLAVSPRQSPRDAFTATHSLPVARRDLIGSAAVRPCTASWQKYPSSNLFCGVDMKSTWRVAPQIGLNKAAAEPLSRPISHRTRNILPSDGVRSTAADEISAIPFGSSDDP